MSICTECRGQPRARSQNKVAATGAHAAVTQAWVPIAAKQVAPLPPQSASLVQIFEQKVSPVGALKSALQSRPEPQALSLVQYLPTPAEFPSSVVATQVVAASTGAVVVVVLPASVASVGAVPVLVVPAPVLVPLVEVVVVDVEGVDDVLPLFVALVGFCPEVLQVSSGSGPLSLSSALPQPVSMAEVTVVTTRAST